MKGKESSKLHAHHHHHSGDSRELAAQLAPLEELHESSEADQINSQVVSQGNGDIVVGVGQAKIAKEAIATEEQNATSGLEPVVIVIVGLLLAFIAFIAWQISQMQVR